MITIILGIILGVLIVLLSARFGWEFDDVFSSAAVVIMLSVLIAIFIPLQGFHEEELVDEIELVSLSNTVATEGGGAIFVSLSPQNVYSYRYEVEDTRNLGGQSYEVKTLDGSVVEEHESKDCKKPVLLVYETKPKTGWFTFAVLSTKREYVFYVPEGTIDRNVELK